MAGSTEIQPIKENPDRKKAVRVFVFHRNFRLSGKNIFTGKLSDRSKPFSKVHFPGAFPGEMRKEKK